jgi:hypothetical protein
VAVLEGGFAELGGANSIGAITPPAAPLVERLKYLSSICGDIIGSVMGAAAGGSGLKLTGELVSGGGAAGGAEGAGGLAATSAGGG